MSEESQLTNNNISAIIIAKNEEKTIARCISSVSFASEVLVIDANSTDATTEIAKATGAIVYNNPWPGYGAQKNFGMQKAKYEWVLFVDADEVITDSLKNIIIEKTKLSNKDFYWIRIVTTFLGKPLHHIYGHNPRLFKKDSGRWNSAHVHEQVEHIDEQINIKLGDQHSEVIKEPILHYSHDSIKSYLEKMHKYTTLDAKEMKNTGAHRNGKKIKSPFLLPTRLAVKQILKLLFYRGGVLDGIPGIIWSLLSGYYEYEMGKKYIKLIT